MDVRSLIKQRLQELRLGQKDLAVAARVTESYISQLLTRKKLPPAPDRTDIYARMEKFLKLPRARLAKLAELERKEVLKRKLDDSSRPLFKEVRELILHKCAADTKEQIRSIFEREPFGELERFVAQKLLDVVQKLAQEEMENENWLHRVARLGGRSHEQLRVIVLEFLDTDVFGLSSENCVSFLDPLIESWRIDLTTFGMEIVLNRRLASENPKRFEFVEAEPDQPVQPNPGLEEFFQDPSMSGDVTEKESEFLRNLRLDGRRPTSLYYYRELQNLRDPLHFHPVGSSAKRHRGAERSRRTKRRLSTSRRVGNKGASKSKRSP